MTMLDADAKFLLALAATNDTRTYNDSVIRNWARLLSDLDVADCADAIEHYYGDNDKPITPAIIRRTIKELRRKRAEEARNKALFEPYDPVTNPAGLPPLTPDLNRAGRALLLAALAEHKAARASGAVGQKPSWRVRNMLDRASVHSGRWSVFDLVRELGIEVPDGTGNEVAEALGQMALPVEEEDPKWLKARDRARAEKVARTSSTAV